MEIGNGNGNGNGKGHQRPMLQYYIAEQCRRPKCPYEVEDKTPGSENLLAEISLANHDGTMSACSEVNFCQIRHSVLYMYKHNLRMLRRSIKVLLFDNESLSI